MRFYSSAFIPAAFDLHMYSHTLVSQNSSPKLSLSVRAPAHFPVTTVSPHHSVMPLAFGPHGWQKKKKMMKMKTRNLSDIAKTHVTPMLSFMGDSIQYGMRIT